MALSETPQGTQLVVEHTLTHVGFAGRVMVPLGARLRLRRIKDNCEAKAGTSSQPKNNALAATLLTGLITFGSFAVLGGWAVAAILMGLILIHEAGHALAMRWLGLPVRGIYFFPFFGGVAVSGAAYRSEGERGFVALMGPGFSLLTTTGFYWVYLDTGNELALLLAVFSAIINGLNLAPVLPLDGGHVVDALLSASDTKVGQYAAIGGLCLGIVFALYMRWTLLILVLLLNARRVMRPRPSNHRLPPITIAERSLLGAGYFSSLAFYISIAGL